jgi:hypothetical protein
MFKRNWLGLGRIRSDEGFSVYYGHKTLYYADKRGTFQIGYEDDLLIPKSLSGFKSNCELSESDRALILERMLHALEWDGHPARLWTSPE